MWYNIGNQPCGIISAGKRVEKEHQRIMRLKRPKKEKDDCEWKRKKASHYLKC